MLMGTALLMQCCALAVCGKEISEGMAQEISTAKRFRIPIVPLDAFQPEADRELPRNLSVLAQVVKSKIISRKSFHETPPEYKNIHVFIANPHQRDPMGHVDTMLTLPVSAAQFSDSLRSIGLSVQDVDDYYFHSIGTNDDQIRNFLPRTLARDSFNELNVLAAKLYGVHDKALDAFIVAPPLQKKREMEKSVVRPSVKEQLAAVRPKPNEPEKIKKDKPSKGGPEI